jgi:hypothetical protein
MGGCGSRSLRPPDAVCSCRILENIMPADADPYVVNYISPNISQVEAVKREICPPLHGVVRNLPAN